MRHSYALLAVAATIFLAGGNAMPENTNLDDVSAVESLGSIRSVDVAADKKTVLRSHELVNDDDNFDEGLDDDDVDVDEKEHGVEEERSKGANLFAQWKLDQMMRGTKEFKRYKNLKAYGYTPSSLQTKLEKLYGQKYKELWQKYTAHYFSI